MQQWILTTHLQAEFSQCLEFAVYHHKNVGGAELAQRIGAVKSKDEQVVEKVAFESML